MNLRRLLPAFLAGSLLSSFSPALADTITVPANRSSGIGEFAANTPDCHVIGKPKMSVPTKPAHGSVSFQWVASRLGDEAKSCKGRSAHVMRVFYTPNQGYRGEDHFTIGMSFPKYEDSSTSTFYSDDVDVLVR